MKFCKMTVLIVFLTLIVAGPAWSHFGIQYAGNVFQGIVKLDGKPVPFAEVEVEYYNINKIK